MGMEAVGGRVGWCLPPWLSCPSQPAPAARESEGRVGSHGGGWRTPVSPENMYAPQRRRQRLYVGSRASARRRRSACPIQAPGMGMSRYKRAQTCGNSVRQNCLPEEEKVSWNGQAEMRARLVCAARCVKGMRVVSMRRRRVMPVRYAWRPAWGNVAGACGSAVRQVAKAGAW